MPPTSRQHVVALDTFGVITSDDLLCATLNGSLVVCLYDAVEESGAMLHLRVVPSNFDSPVHELTDELLGGDLLLLERCCAALRAACPGARHWQAKIVLHCGTHNELATSGALLLDFVRAHAGESKVEVVHAQSESGPPARVHFRPAMGYVRIGR